MEKPISYWLVDVTGEPVLFSNASPGTKPFRAGVVVECKRFGSAFGHVLVVRTYACHRASARNAFEAFGTVDAGGGNRGSPH